MVLSYQRIPYLKHICMENTTFYTLLDNNYPSFFFQVGQVYSLWPDFIFFFRWCEAQPSLAELSSGVPRLFRLKANLRSLVHSVNVVRWLLLLAVRSPLSLAYIEGTRWWNHTIYSPTLLFHS